MDEGTTPAHELSREMGYNVEEDQDYPETAVNSHILVEEIEMNGQK